MPQCLRHSKGWLPGALGTFPAVRAALTLPDPVLASPQLHLLAFPLRPLSSPAPASRVPHHHRLDTMSNEASDSRRRGSIEDGDSLLPPSASTSSSAPTSAPAPAPAAPSSDAADDDAEAAELAAMRARVAEMEAEAAKLRELTAASEAASSSGGGGDGTDVNMSDEDREAVDSRSIYVGNVRCLSRGSSLLIPLTLCFIHRSTTTRRRKRSSSTLRRAAPSTASRSCSTSTPVRKGAPLSSVSSFLAAAR